MPCNKCSLDGVTISCTLDQRCPAGQLCTITNTNTDHAVIATVTPSFQPPAQSVPFTVTLPPGASQTLGCDNDGLGQITTFDITGVQKLSDREV